MLTVSQSRDAEASLRRQLFGNRSAVTVLVALCIAALLVTGCGEATTRADRAPTATERPSLVHSRSLPGTPSPAPTQFSPEVDYQVAWGPHAVTATYSMTIDATHTFIPTAVSPDGLTLLGNEQINSVTYQAGYFNPATRVFTPIGVSDYGGPVGCCSTDGRFIVAEDTDCRGCTGSPHWMRYWAYDLDTRQLRLVASGEEAYQDLYGYWFSNGFLLFSSDLGMEVANLAAGTVAPLGVIKASPAQISVDDFSWPYLIYNPPYPSSAIWLYNFQSGQNTQFSALESFTAAHVGTNSNVAISGDTIYVPSGEAPISSNGGVPTLYALDHVLSGGTGQRELGTYNGEPGCVNAANTRLVVCQSTVWDLALHEWVTFPNLYTPLFLSGVPINLGGNFLEVLQTTSGGGSRVLLFNTANLPTS